MGANWPGRGADHPLPTSTKIKERVEPCHYYSVPAWPVIARNLLGSVERRGVAIYFHGHVGRMSDVTLLMHNE